VLQYSKVDTNITSMTVKHKTWSVLENNLGPLPSVTNCGDMLLVYNGGNSSAFLLNATDWEFAFLASSENSVQTTDLLAKIFELTYHELCIALQSDLVSAQTYLTKFLQSDFFKEKCRDAQGNASVFITIRKDNYLFWLSVGTIKCYIVSAEQHELLEGAHGSSVGKVNTFEEPTPIHASGTTKLATAHNFVFVTDIQSPQADALTKLWDEYHKMTTPTKTAPTPMHIRIDAGQYLAKHLHDNKLTGSLLWWKI